ncbi:MAG TPA: SH3 domain-containing protein [Longimicrobiales bacterium]|nr:SH3 domain-containing protein [Longimicrobiales bacterium]
MQLYEAGKFKDAAHAFEVQTQSNEHDVAAWNNLGNAYFRAGDRGRAIWAWSRATREAPRDAASIANLQAAGAVEVLRTRPPLSVRPVEWYLLAALCWWLAAALIAIAILRKKRELLVWSGVLCLLAAVFLTTGSVADNKRYAVAIETATKLYGDPTVHSPVVRTVQSGAGLDVLENRGEWVRVRTLTQAEGWVESDAIGLL